MKKLGLFLLSFGLSLTSQTRQTAAQSFKGVIYAASSSNSP